MKSIEVKIGEKKACLKGYLHDKSPSWEAYDKRPAVLICPGGGYEFVSDREMDPVALEWLAKGYQVFILSYSVGVDAGHFQPLKEVSRAVVLLREQAQEWGIDEHGIAVIGFSAGAHLALSLGVLRNRPEIVGEASQNRPDALILCYPVVTAGEFAHEGSFEMLTGEKRGESWEAFSLEKQVGDDMPPCFLWHTVSDTCVPVENSLLLMEALHKKKIPFEAHLYPEGEHGMSMCTGEVCGESADSHVETWFLLCVEWLNRQFHFH